MKLIYTDEMKADIIAFQELLNTDPQSTENFKGLFDYVPISAVEDDLNELFYQYDIIITSTVQTHTGIVYNISLQVVHPITGRMIRKDGTGAVTLYSDFKKEGTDVNEYGLVTSLEMAAPLAYAEAIKNAAKKFGKRFGADLNREYDAKYRKQKPTAFDVIEFDITTIKTMNDVRKALVGGHINADQAEKIKTDLSLTKKTGK